MNSTTSQDGEPKGKEITRQRILDAATEVFAEKGYHGAGVEDIVKASETSKGAFYFHFPSKQDIFFALLERLSRILGSRVDEAITREARGVAKVDAALTTVFRTLSHHRKLAKILLVGGVGLGRAFDERLLRLHEQFARRIQRHLEEAVQGGDLPRIDPELTAFAWLGAINEVVVRWLYTGQPDPLEQALPYLRALLLRSIGVQPREDPPAEM